MSHETITEDDGPSLNPHEAAQLIADQESRAHRIFTRPVAGIYLAWGLAYCIGFGSLAFSLRSHQNISISLSASWVFSLCLIAAAIVSIVINIRLNRGISGSSTKFGAMFGWAWILSFLAGSVLCTLVINTSGMKQVPSTMFSIAVSLLIVGVLYLAMGAVNINRGQYITGVVMLVLAVLTVAFPANVALPVLTAVGGGTFLIMAALCYFIDGSNSQTRRMDRKARS